MALRIVVTLQMNVDDGSFTVIATYRDTVTTRQNSVTLNQPDSGDSVATIRSNLLQAAVDACNSDNTTGADGETTTATTADIAITNG